MISPLSRSLAVVLIAFLLHSGQPARAQAARKSTTTRAANVQAGSLVSLDADAATLVLKPKTGTDVTYRYTDKTHTWREKKVAETSAFKAGDAVVVRFRKSSVGPPSLYDLCDKPSWEWVNRLRHETTKVTVAEVTEEELHAVEGADKSPVSYRVTEKTAWSKAAKPAAPADFKAGEAVYVVPRLLPNGSVMAIAVSDAPSDAAKLKERSRFTVSGVVKTIKLDERKLNLASLAGDIRDLDIASECIVRQSGKDVPLSTVKPAMAVTLHLTRNEEGEQVIKQITIQSRKSASRSIGTKSVKKPGAGPGKTGVVPDKPPV